MEEFGKFKLNMFSFEITEFSIISYLILREFNGKITTIYEKKFNKNIQKNMLENDFLVFS